MTVPNSFEQQLIELVGDDEKRLRTVIEHAIGESLRLRGLAPLLDVLCELRVNLAVGILAGVYRHLGDDAEVATLDRFGAPALVTNFTSQERITLF